jgi:N-methylhydantoinase B/oxoprolinase/acetone carboxylase alpha subunit
METPGGGGYGDPHSRTASMVDRDGASGKFSKSFLKKYYGR